MKTGALVVLLAVLLLGLARADVYLHNPRGSNNRLNNPNNAQNLNNDENNRLFNSENNNAGGYEWGPPMSYYVGSILPIEWTNQHGCGEKNPNVRCEIILQYMCGEEVRDGATITQIANDATYDDQVDGSTVADEYYQAGESVYLYGMHESREFFQTCNVRERNRHLFVADQNPCSTARCTRQTPNGNTEDQRYGFECTEERDYYPYWHPSPWIDIAVLTDDPDRCDFYRSESHNVKSRHECSLSEYNNEQDCEANDGSWNLVRTHLHEAPECMEAPHSRDNHLGNGADGYANTYNWTIPDNANDHCVLRIRYNISTDDYDGWDIDAERNGNESPVRNDPKVTINDRRLQLAINTQQFGRTFQDRSHTFEIKKRPSDISSQARIWNLNVRGKRGNIVQVYPSVEYDFVPQRLEATVGDYIHFQWTGSDYNPSGNDGEGQAKTDRSNMVFLDGAGRNKPLAFRDGDFFVSEDDEDEHLFVRQTGCAPEGDEGDSQLETNCAYLNAANRHFDGGLIRLKPRHSGNTYHYMSTRNNNFSNRSQKGQIIVLEAPDVSPFLIAAIGLVVFGATVVVVTPLALLAPTLVFVVVSSISQRI